MTTTFSPVHDASPFRRIAASMWRRPSDPSIHGMVDIDATQALAFIESERARTGRKVTMTHVVAHALAKAFAENPDLNAKIRFGGRIERRSRVDLVLSVARDGGRDLSAAKLEGADDMSFDELVQAATAQVGRTRMGEDKDYERSRGTLAKLPWWLVGPLLWLTDVAGNELHLHLPGIGMPRDPFGTAVITNVGMFGIDTAFAPFVPMGRCAMLLLVTEVKPRPVVVDGQVVARPVLRLCATFDHRVVDGAGAGRLARTLVAAIENPSGASLRLAS